MNVLVWWRDKRINTMPRFRWFRRRKLEAASALRIAIVSSSPTHVKSFNATPSQPDPVNWLLSNILPSTEDTHVLNLEPVSDRIKLSRSVSPDRTTDATSTGITNPTSREDDGPTLVERLRILLEVPLDLLEKKLP